ncbi:hypothetical protein B0A50_03294 [Salinomyces thailandicus]|uniref:Origin recognition complex subunit 2 n=1 Tax=Salinomyces thailandicus TaxID=706561 RepID=A0A4U0U1Q5_9PEZI|nr:hypothetical protein B0A50_03294 [Salinomyces thailandica]
MAKRRREVEEVVNDDLTPRKTRRSAIKDISATASSPVSHAETPSGRKGILRGTPTKANGTASADPTPKSLRKVLFSTPAKHGQDEGDEETPTATRNDRSARRKSQRTLQKQVADGEESEEEEDARDEAVAAAILGEAGSDIDDDNDAIQVAEPSSAPDTPSKSGKPRGRPKGRRRERTPSPPPDLPPHELYFFQNRAGGNKTSANTLASNLLLTHEDYYAQVTAYEDPHEQDVKRLQQLHERGFEQWRFELEEGFNLCLYGYGSKRALVMEFAEHVYAQVGERGKPGIVIVNGYTPGVGIREVLTALGGVLLPKGVKMPAQPAAMEDMLLSALAEAPPKQPLLLIIHSLDHPNLRKPATQATIARLAAKPGLNLLATCDTPHFPLLWDTSLTRHLHFLYHDTTTFQPYRAEFDVVEDVNALLGRSGRRLGGKDGVGYVLKSLPENARNLFRILVAEQLVVADSEGDAATIPAYDDSDIDADAEAILGDSDEEAAANQQSTPSRRGRGRPAKKPAKAKSASLTKPVVSAPQGVEYRTLYHKAVEEFVCSSELNFRTLLKEFHDHQMVESRKDAGGTERLVVPFRREELEGLLEELV